MRMFLILSPFAALSALMAVAPATVALFAAAAVAFVLVVADAWQGRSFKLLQIGTTVLLASVGTYVLFIDRHFGGVAARIAVDLGMLTIALVSLAVRFPFTIQYARETVDDETAARPEFRRSNYLLTWVWTSAFVLMLIADIGTIYASWLPLWTGVAAAFAAKNAAASFTQWYAANRRAKAVAERANLVRMASSHIGGEPA